MSLLNLNIFGGNSRDAPMQPPQMQAQQPQMSQQDKYISSLDPQAQMEFQDDAVVAMIQKEFKRRQDERRPFELQWRLNQAFLEGNQYVDINPVSMALDEIPKMFWWQEREVFNIVAPNIEMRSAKLGRMRPILKCRPGTGEQQDVRSAKVGTQLLKNNYYDEGIQLKLGDVICWMEACGTGFFKNTWNRNSGKIFAKMISQDPNTMQEIAEEIREGNLDVVAVPTPEIYPDSCYHQEVTNCRSIIHAKTYHLDEIEEIWGTRVPAEQTTAMQLQRSMTGIGGLGYGLGGFNIVTTKLENHAVVMEYWEIPTKKFSQGRLLIVASGRVLYKGPLPFPVGEDGQLALPFTKVDCIRRPGIFWGKTVSERLIPPQRRYNALRNRKAEYLNRCSIGQWTYEENSVDEEYLEDNAGAPGAIIPFKKGFNRPEHVQNDQLPAAFDTEERTLLNEISILSGVSELSRQSQAPSGTSGSGVSLAIALEQDDTRLSTTAGNIEQFIVQSGKQWLRLHKAFVKLPRTLRSIGRNNVVEVMDWTAGDLRSDDVVVESFSALAESPAQRRQMVFDLMGTPLVLDPETGKMTKEMQSKLLEMIELGHWEATDDDNEVHINKAERENRDIVQGMFPMPVTYDDHVLHMSRHNNYRLTVDYEAMKAQNPMLEVLFQQHVQVHMAYIGLHAQQLVSQIMPPPGAPGLLPPAAGGMV
ncbi:hypothetical protein [Phosphitispora fastidiosa]|uniref:portal protein n=1 Tax=Phosphitispora fastidiosa TaxID=2837202 RepID=UPI001E5F6B97|nr:hypothetical protein [Phosphitispora fastidiosa]MBU7006309.1 hypothetical protein [Phosphitispora fastidiosa]